jgi:formate dehydrogenase gamma subunit
VKDHRSVEYVTRFSWWDRLQHTLVIVIFMLLIVTGMPQKWPYAELSRWMIEQMGGIYAVRWLHRASGIAFAGLAVAHLATVIAGLITRRLKPSLLLTRKDFRDTIDNLRYYLGREENPPRFGRFDYRQKFEYWGIIFGSAIMILSGFVLYFPIEFARVLPADLIPAAKVMHSYEALLALLIVLVWHMYGALLSPDVFPFDSSIFTGKISKERLKHEHPLEYEELFGKR